MASDFSIGGKKWPGLSKLIEECGEVMQIAGNRVSSADGGSGQGVSVNADDRDDDDEVGLPVQQLSPNEPLNRALGAFQLLFIRIHESALEFVDSKLRKAKEDGFKGWIDIKMTIEPERLIFRRRLRKQHEAPPPGRWWSLPIMPAIVDELLERIKPAPPEEVKPTDVVSDASAPVDPAPANTRPSALLKARAGEAAALALNIRRTNDELKALGYECELKGIAEALDAMHEALEGGAIAFTPQ
jgi:hypothetical protein